MLIRALHRPAHLLVDDTPYFITAAIEERRPLLRDGGLKGALIEHIAASFAAFHWELHDWVVLDEHYHLLGMSRRGADLPRLMQRIHGGFSARIREGAGHTGAVWSNYWDYCPRDEGEYRVRQNYLLYNPVKHGYVADLHDYPDSSFAQTLGSMGRDALARQFRRHHGFRGLRLEEGDF